MSCMVTVLYHFSCSCCLHTNRIWIKINYIVKHIYYMNIIILIMRGVVGRGRTAHGGCEGCHCWGMLGQRGCGGCVCPCQVMLRQGGCVHHCCQHTSAGGWLMLLPSSLGLCWGWGPCGMLLLLLLGLGVVVVVTGPSACHCHCHHHHCR